MKTYREHMRAAHKDYWSKVKLKAKSLAEAARISGVDYRTASKHMNHVPSVIRRNRGNAEWQALGSDARNGGAPA